MMIIFSLLATNENVECLCAASKRHTMKMQSEHPTRRSIKYEKSQYLRIIKHTLIYKSLNGKWTEEDGAESAQIELKKEK